jgi:hypothetical protein
MRIEEVNERENALCGLLDHETEELIDHFFRDRVPGAAFEQ